MLSGLSTGSMLAAGYFDWNSWTLPGPASFVLGMVMLVMGNIGFVSATFGLGIEGSCGQEGKLRTGGFYQYSRNPQLLFLFVVLLGSISFANSDAILIVAVAVAMWFALMPLAEEPWLQEQYGEAYRRYRQSTPRFIYTRTGRRLVGSIGRFNDGGYRVNRENDIR